MATLLKKAFLVAVVAGAGLVLTGCSKGVEGKTYEAGAGGMELEFQSGGKANFGIMGQKQPCTYSQDGKKVSVTCEGQKADLTLNDDGSLSGPPESFIP